MNFKVSPNTEWNVNFFSSQSTIKDFCFHILFLNCRSKGIVLGKNWKRHPSPLPTTHTVRGRQRDTERNTEKDRQRTDRDGADTPSSSLVRFLQGPLPSLWLLPPKSEMHCDKNNLLLWITAEGRHLAPLSTTGKQQCILFAILVVCLFQSYANLIPGKVAQVSSFVNFLFYLFIFFNCCFSGFNFFEPQTPLNSYYLLDAVLGFACRLLQGAAADCVGLLGTGVQPLRNTNGNWLQSSEKPSDSDPDLTFPGKESEWELGWRTLTTIPELTV